MSDDPWNTRIEETGCAQENELLQICRYDTGDWRKCLKEMKAFRECWIKHNNMQRVAAVEATHVQSLDMNLTGEKHNR